MPDRVARHQLELGGTFGTIARPTGILPPTIGGPHAAYGLLDNLVLEAGVNLEFVYFNWATHWVGARVVHRHQLGAWVFSADGELGAGAGLSNLRSDRQFVAGGYVGGGLGFRWNWLGLFTRGRLDVSQALGLPTLLWPTMTAGIEARAGQYVVTSLGGGAACSWNGGSSVACFALMQLSVSLLFDLSPRPLER